MTPKVSVIVPVYKAEAYLHRCVDSILAQTFQDFEVLLIDDGSPDKSGEICDEYAKKDNRIRVFHKENGGVSSARNLGLDNARGEWIYFVDADDALFDSCLETLFSKTSNLFDCIIGGYVEVKENNVISIIPNEIESIWDYKKTLLDFYQSQYFHFNGYLWNRIFRHSIIEQNHLRFHEDIYYKEDGLFLVEFICKSKKDSFITTKPVYKYYINPHGAMQSLKLHFETKYLTNMNARILCWENIKSVTQWHDFRLRIESKRCIVQLYYMVLYYLNCHQVKDDSIKKNLYFQMKQSVSVPCLYRFYDLGVRAINKIQRISLCKRKE